MTTFTPKANGALNLPTTKKIIAMFATLNALKRHLKLDKKLVNINKKGGNNKGSKKVKNKKNTSNKVGQKKDKAWEKIPPYAGKKKTKEHGKFTYHLCKHHMAWTVHTPSDCRLGKERKDD
jgi:hypothetical protein